MLKLKLRVALIQYHR